MILKKNGSLEWLEFEILSSCEKLKHRIFLKRGGVSKSPRDELNLGYHCGDDPEAVKINRQLAYIDNFVGGYHIHGTCIKEVVDTHSKEIPDCDGLMTQSTNVGLISTHADCQTALFYDPIQHVIANTHCGWRGNVQNIYAATVAALQNRFGSKPENLLVGIGPSLGPEHAQFIHYKTELPEAFCE